MMEWSAFVICFKLTYASKQFTCVSKWLAYNKISDKGASHLSEALMENMTLQSIRLVGNSISDELKKRLNECPKLLESIIITFI